MLGHFQTLLESIVADPEQRLSDFPLLTKAERQQLLLEWNGTKTDYPKDKCLHQWFEASRTQEPVPRFFAPGRTACQRMSRSARFSSPVGELGCWTLRSLSWRRLAKPL